MSVSPGRRPTRFSSSAIRTKPWVHAYGGVLFINCGSVGKPKDGDPRGAFAILRATRAGVAARIERVPYDAGAVAREVVAAGLPAEYADKLLTAV